MTKYKGITVNLDGKDFVVPPMNFRTLQALQARLETFTGGTDSASIDLVIDCLHGALARNYPALTREACIDMLDLENMEAVMEAVMDVSGLRRKAQEAAAAAKEATDSPPSTGLSSTPA
jgi:hypothetical protein